MGVFSRSAGAADARLRAQEERARREGADLVSDEAAPPASSASARAARAARAQGAARPRPRRWSAGKVAALCIVFVLVAALATVTAAFTWLRWFSHDDAADIQGTWYLAGTSTPITITADRIQLTDDVAYGYTLDPEAKTIAFSFGNLAGGGCYRFSLDRDELALTDGSFTGLDTLGRDLGWTARAVVEQLAGGDMAPAEASAKGLTLLSRTPSSGTAPPPASDKPADAADAGADSPDGSQTIEDEPMGDLPGNIPADINDPRDKAADDDAAGSDDTAPGDGAAASDGGSAGSGEGASSGAPSSGASAPASAGADKAA